MKRASMERFRTTRVWRQHLARHGVTEFLCRCEGQPGRFRKGQRRGGCRKARCYLCHGDKLWKRPTRQQRRADLTYQEWQHQEE